MTSGSLFPAFRWVSVMLRGKIHPEKQFTFFCSCWPEFKFLCQTEKQTVTPDKVLSLDIDSEVQSSFSHSTTLFTFYYLQRKICVHNLYKTEIKRAVWSFKTLIKLASCFLYWKELVMFKVQRHDVWVFCRWIFPFNPIPRGRTKGSVGKNPLNPGTCSLGYTPQNSPGKRASKGR